jgi:hypothetical protein
VDLGFGFYVKGAAVIVGLGIAALIVFLLIGVAWAAWGFFGMLLGVSALLLLIGWIYDRRAAKEREALD